MRQKSYYLFEFGIAASQATHRELESNRPLPDRCDVALASRHGGQQILQAAPPFATRKACSVSATKMRRRPRSVELHWRARRSRLRHNLGCAEDAAPQIVLQNPTLAAINERVLMFHVGHPWPMAYADLWLLVLLALRRTRFFAK